MKQTILAVALALAANLAFAAASEQGCASSGGQAAGCSNTANGGAGGAGGNATSTSGASLNATLSNSLRNSNTNVLRTNLSNDVDVNNRVSNDQKQAQKQAQAQKQGQDQTAVGVGVGVGISEGSKADSGGNVLQVNEAKQDRVASSAPSVIASVAAACGLSVGGSGQGALFGGAFSWGFEGDDCKTIREAVTLWGFGLQTEAKLHLCQIRNIRDTMHKIENPMCAAWDAKHSDSNKIGRK